MENIMSLLGLIKSNGLSGFGYNSTAEMVTEGLDLTGQNFLITGCATGLGLETARVLSKRGAFIIAANRSEARCADALSQLAGKGAAVVCDLGSLASVVACCETVKKMEIELHGIICNAGIMAPQQLELIQGVESQFYVNHLSHFRLVDGLRSQLASAGRVVVLSSAAHQAADKGGIQFGNIDGSQKYRPWTFYGQSKLANLLFARSLGTRLSLQQKVFAVHPGVIHTELVRYMNPMIKNIWSLTAPLGMKSVAQGAATQVWAATSTFLNDKNGIYLADCNEKGSSRYGRDIDLAERLWEWTEKKLTELVPAT